MTLYTPLIVPPLPLPPHFLTPSPSHTLPLSPVYSSHQSGWNSRKHWHHHTPLCKWNICNHDNQSCVNFPLTCRLINNTLCTQQWVDQSDGCPYYYLNRKWNHSISIIVSNSSNQWSPSLSPIQPLVVVDCNLMAAFTWRWNPFNSKWSQPFMETSPTK